MRLNRIIEKIHGKLRYALHPCPLSFTIKDGDTAEQVVDRVSKIADDKQFFDAISLLSTEWVTTDALLSRHDMWDRVMELWRKGFKTRRWENTYEVMILITLLDLEPKENLDNDQGI